MRQNEIRLLRFRLSVAFSFAALGVITCSILSPGTAAFTPGAPSLSPSRRIQSTTTFTNTNTRIPTFTPTLFPTLTFTPTQTGTPYPKDEWISLGPEGGEVENIVIDPTTPTTLYAATWSAGIFKSTNGGKEWRVIKTDRILHAHTFLLDPFFPSTLYILSSKGGIYKSSDGGNNWNEIYPDYDSKPDRPELVLLAIDPSRPSTLYAKNRDQQILRSTNGGVSWGVVGNVRDVMGEFMWTDVFLEVVPKNPTALFIGTMEGLYRSIDGGATWKKSGEFEEARFLSADPKSPDTLYLGSGGALYVSTNGGMEWETVQNENFNIQDLVIDPKNPSQMYAISGDSTSPVSPVFTHDAVVRASKDGGRHWSDIYHPEETSIFCLAIDPGTPLRLYAGTSSGFFQSLDGGKTWEAHNSGLTAEQFGGMVIDPTAPCRFYRSKPGTLMKSEDCGVHWTKITTITPDNVLPDGSLLLDKNHPSTLYLLGVHNILKSQDGGENWREIITVSPLEAITFFDMDPRNPEVLYMIEMGGTAHYTNIQKSNDGGENWEKLSSPAITVFSLTIVPTVPTIIYALTADGIFTSEDSGYRWEAIDAGIPPLEIEDLLADPLQPEILYLVSAKSKLFISRDGGVSWEKIHTNLSEMDWLELVIDPVIPSTMYSYTYKDGIFKSTDGGRNWTPINTGLKTKKINTIMFDPQDHLILYAGTGGGLYTMHLSN
jgi:photosystem II stability/assembly factor-like uncharacterized protein